MIFSHIFGFAYPAWDSLQYKYLMMDEWFFKPMNSSIHTVEIFVVIAGFFAAYNFCEFSKKNPKKNMLKYVTKKIIARFFSMNVFLIVVILIAITTGTYLKDTSQFLLFDNVEGNCKKYWWRNLLLISNFFPRKEICMTWSWYAAVDFQLFLVGGVLMALTAK